MKSMDEDIRWIPIPQAAKLLGISRQRVAILCKEGVLATRNYGGKELVSVRSCLARAESCRQKGLYDDGDR